MYKFAAPAEITQRGFHFHNKILVTHQRVLFTLLILLASAILISPSDTRASDDPSQVPQKKNWTLLVFMNGNNDLDSYGAKDLNEMETVGSTGQTNVVVQWASLEAETTRRVFVQKDSDPSTVTSPVIEDLGLVDMGSYRSLVDFVKWGAQNYPAEHYFVVIWNHGGGWRRGRIVDGERDISWDELSGNHITTLELTLATREIAAALGKKLDVLGTDACLMAMPEVARQISDHTDYLVGSEELEPGEGWPYGEWLDEWLKLEQVNAETISNALIKTFVQSYSHGSQGHEEVTLSALHLRHVADFHLAWARVSDSIQRSDLSVRKALYQAGAEALRFDVPDNVDLGDLVKSFLHAGLHLQGSVASQVRELQTYLLQVQLAHRQLISGNGATPKYKRAQGSAIWFPQDPVDYKKVSHKYRKLLFDQETGWSRALESLYAAVDDKGD